jgi:hypothetical protein
MRTNRQMKAVPFAGCLAWRGNPAGPYSATAFRQDYIVTKDGSSGEWVALMNGMQKHGPASLKSCFEWCERKHKQLYGVLA